MNADPLSTRHRGSPLTRRSRDVPAPTNNCLEVRWRFLQHKNPKLPQFGSPSRNTLLVDPITPHALHLGPSAQSEGTHQAARGSPSRLFHMFETQDAEADETNPVSVGPTATQESNLPESPRASRTLNDLMGETQRQAMLDRILADMEYLVVEPTYSRLGQTDNEKTNSPRNAQRARSHKPSILQTALQNEPNLPKNRVHARQRKFTALWTISSQGGYLDAMDDVDDDDDSADGSDTDRGHESDRKRRQRRKLQQLNPGDQGPRIFWQKTTGTRSAADVPDRLLTLSPSPPRRLRSSHNIVLGRRSYTSRQLLPPSTLSEGHQRSKGNLTGNTTSPPAGSTASPRRRRRVPAAPASPGRNSSTEAPASPSKPHYGAWYVPQSEWWTLHQLEQQSLADKLPAASAASSDADEPHCHGSSTSPTQRQHKPPLPPSALSPRGQESTPSKPSGATSSGGSSRIPSASARSAPPSAPGPLELHAAGIPHSYIGREYRAYIISTGSAMPQYLQ